MNWSLRLPQASFFLMAVLTKMVYYGRWFVFRCFHRITLQTLGVHIWAYETSRSWPCSGPKKQGQPVRAKKYTKTVYFTVEEGQGYHIHIMILCNLPVVLLKLKKQNIFKQYTVETPCIGIHGKKSAAGTSWRASPTSPKKRSKIWWSNAAQSMSRHLTSQDSRALYPNELAWREKEWSEGKWWHPWGYP